MSPPVASSSLEFSLADEAATLALGAHLANELRPGCKVYLHGDLGAGKTTLVRGVLRGLGEAGRVKSPTYTLVELYKLSKLDLYHFDLYRFKDPSEWEEAGLRELFSEPAAILVEWPERAADLLPPADLDVSLWQAGLGRHARFVARSTVGESMLREMAGSDEQR